MIPKSVLNDVVKYHNNNCLVVDIDYISIIPTYENCYRQRIYVMTAIRLLMNRLL